MRLELVTVGTELLLGQTVDTNAAVAGMLLAGQGLRIVRRATVPDEPDAIRDAVAGALQRTGLVLVTGGLGPTQDDVTRDAVAELFGQPLEFRDDVWAAIGERFRRMGREPAPANRSQALVPRGATVLPNRWGTAPGLWVEGDTGIAVLIPGVPHEMRMLLEHEVLPRLMARRQAGNAEVIRSVVVRTTGMPESTLGERVAPLASQLDPLTLAYLPGFDGVDLRITAWELEEPEALARLEAAARLVEGALPGTAYGRDEEDLAALVLAAARQQGLTLGLAESCTGGMLGARLTAIAGSSDVFIGGVTCYADHIKTELLGVDADLLARCGAVSRETAEAMARGAAARLGTDLSVAITGIAGPDGGTADKPVGTVWLAWLVRGAVESTRVLFPGPRENVRVRAAQAALHGLLRRLPDRAAD